MNTESVKQSVVDSYGKLAKSTQSGLFSKLFACCDLSDNANQVGETIGYSKEELSAVPEGSNLGVGCGNPSALAKIKKGQTVLDLGSGAGFDAFLASPLVGDHGKVIGVDLSEDMLSLATRNAKKGKYANVEFINGDIEDLPIDDATVDHIISNCVINLSLNKGDVYKEAFRVLKKGGKLSISDIVLEKELPEVIKNSLAGHIACVSGAEKLETYLQYVEQAGFKDIRIDAKANFPLELMLTDPQVMKIAKEMNFNLNSEEAKDIASRVSSISISANKY
ncbi:arsenite methyltransferase [Ekhidna sp.]|uniref:arsenite methyltransferase n=1 Tax=Ekhidna sp. TaxID=2608089 RepID=UPI003298DA7C